MDVHERAKVLLEEYSDDKVAVIKQLKEEYSLELTNAKQIVDDVCAEKSRIHATNENVKKIFCTSCGNEVQDNWTVCPQCGKVLKYPQNESQIQEIKQEGKKSTLRKIFELIWGCVGAVIGIYFLLILISSLMDKNDHANDNKGTVEDFNIVAENKDKTKKENESLDEESAKILNADMPIEVKNVNQAQGITYVDFGVTMVNNSGADIKEARFGIMAWDKNGLPKIVNWKEEYLEYVIINNLAEKQTSEFSVTMDMDGVAKYVQIFCLEYTDFEGNIWENPYKKYIESNSGVKLEKVKGEYFIFGEETSESEDVTRQSVIDDAYDFIAGKTFNLPGYETCIKFTTAGELIALGYNNVYHTYSISADFVEDENGGYYSLVLIIDGVGTPFDYFKESSSIFIYGHGDFSGEWVVAEELS